LRPTPTKRVITHENLRAIPDQHSPELTIARWRRTRGKLVRVLFFGALLGGTMQLCARTSRDNGQPQPTASGPSTRP
jgi:hypothetical protein